MIQNSNHTEFPNEIIDIYMHSLSHISFKVVAIIVRKTRGWHKESDSISVSQIIKLSGLSKSSVLRSINELEQLDIIKVDRVSDGITTNKYTINYKEKEVSERDRGGVCEKPVGGVCEKHTKYININKKEYIAPTLKEIQEYIKLKGYNVDATKFYEYYSSNDWKDKNNKPVKNWKLKLLVWRRDDTPTNKEFKDYK